MLTRKVVDVLSLEIFKVRLDTPPHYKKVGLDEFKGPAQPKIFFDPLICRMLTPFPM